MPDTSGLVSNAILITKIENKKLQRLEILVG